MNPVAPWAQDRPVRNNNPGDLRPRGTWPPWPGQSAVDHAPGGPFAIFTTLIDGWAALALWCLDARYLRGLTTARQMVAVFAPGAENDTASYAQMVAARVGEAELDLGDEQRLAQLCWAIAHYEDYRAPWTAADVQDGVALAEKRWPGFRATRLGGGFPPHGMAPAGEIKGARMPLPPDPETERLNQAELDRIRDAKGTEDA